MWNLKNGTDELIYKTETDSQTENKHGYGRGSREGYIRSLGLADTNYYI